MIDKKELDINGDHTRLGRELNMVEFKGFTAAKIDSIEKTLVRIEGTMNGRIKDCEDDINDLQAFKNKVLGLAIATGTIAGVTGNMIFNFLSNLLWK